VATFDNQLLDALSAPLGQVISAVGRGIADAQRELDTASIAALQEIYGSNDELFRELQRIGYRPTWYHIPEAEGEIQMALTVTGEGTATNAAPGARRLKLYAAPMNAGYTSRYDFKMEASSRLKFRIVPVPPSGPAEALLVVPAVVGLSWGEARSRLELLRIPHLPPADAKTTDLVSKQTPAAGSILADGQEVALETS